MSHLTIPGTFDVMGAGLHALPGILIGFNKDVAWSHTVSTALRFTFHELTLNPENPLEYIVDGEIRAPFLEGPPFFRPRYWTGRYWTSTVNGSYARYMSFSPDLHETYYNPRAGVLSGFRADGHSVRCIKD